MAKRVLDPERKTHLDILRVLALCAVLFIHSGRHGSTLFLEPVSTPERGLSLALTLFARFAVPVFFMISGALLLDKQEPLRVVLRKRVLRIAVVAAVTFAVYYFLIHLYLGDLALQPYTLFLFCKSVYAGPITAPLWYLYAYLAAMLMLPFLRRTAQNMTLPEFRYLFMLHILLVCIVSVLNTFVFRETLSAYFAVPFATETAMFYMLLGYALEHRLPAERFTGKTAFLTSVAAVAAVLLGGALTVLVCRRDGTAGDAPFVLFDSFAVFPALAVWCVVRTWTKDHVLSLRVKQLCAALAENVFGIYLIEKLLRESFEFCICDPLEKIITPLPACFVWLLCCFVAGQIIIWLLRRIPFVRKFIG